MKRNALLISTSALLTLLVATGFQWLAYPLIVSATGLLSTVIYDIIKIRKRFKHE